MSDDPYSQVPPPPPPMGEAPPPPPPMGAAPPPPPPPPPPGGYAASPSGGSGGGPISENRQIYMVLSYLGLLALIPYLLEKEDREVQWHAKHGLVICGAEIVLAIVLGVVMTVINMVTGCLGCVAGPVVVLAMLVLHVMLIVKALNGERLLIPGISQYADQF